MKEFDRFQFPAASVFTTYSLHASLSQGWHLFQNHVRYRTVLKLFFLCNRFTRPPRIIMFYLFASIRSETERRKTWSCTDIGMRTVMIMRSIRLQIPVCVHFVLAWRFSKIHGDLCSLRFLSTGDAKNNRLFLFSSQTR